MATAASPYSPAPVMPDAPHVYSGERFASAFWDAHDRGVDIIFEKLYKSKQTCEEIKQLYAVRAQIEDDYGERLLKLAQQMIGREEQDTLADALSNIPAALETTARAHIELAQKLKLHLEAPLDGFLREQREHRRTQQLQIENSRQLKNLHYANATRARDFYLAECKKVDEYKQFLDEHGSEVPEENLKEVQRELDEAIKMANAAELEYRRAVDVFNTVSKDWINNWTRTCDSVQAMEEKRLKYIRSSLLAFASTMTYAYEADGQFCERIRAALEIADVTKDMHAFVTKHGTGHELPEPMRFERYTFWGANNEKPTVTHHTPPAVVTPPANGNEHLKPVETQVKITHFSSKEELRNHQNAVPVHDTTTQPPDTMSMAFRDVESMLAPTGQRQEAASAIQREPSPPATSTPKILAPSGDHSDVDDVSLEAKAAKPTVVASSAKSDTSYPASVQEDGDKYKPIANPGFRTSSNVSSQVSGTGASHAEEHTTGKEPLGTRAGVTADIHNMDHEVPESNETKCMPKDEKWVISSVRRAGQVPVVSPSAQLHDGMPTPQSASQHASVTQAAQDQPTENATPDPPAEHSHENGKPHRPNPGLKIDIPNKHKEQMPQGQHPIGWHPAPGMVMPSMPPNPANVYPPVWQEEHQLNFAQVPLQQGSIHQAPVHQVPVHQAPIYQAPVHQAPVHQAQQTFTVEEPMAAQRYEAYGNQPIPSLSNTSLAQKPKDEPPATMGKKQKDLGAKIKDAIWNEPHSEKNNADKEKPVKEKSNRFSLSMFSSKKEKHHSSNTQGTSNLNAIHSNPSSLVNLPNSLHSPPQNPPVQRPMSAMPAMAHVAYPPEGPVDGNAFKGPMHPQENRRPMSNPPSMTRAFPQEHQPPKLSDGTPVLEFVKAAWDFNATIPSEMSFHANDYLAVIKKQSDGWWLAELLHTKERGLVPGNYMVKADSPFM